MEAITPSELADLFWSAANEFLSRRSVQHESWPLTGYSCTAIENAAHALGYKIQPYDLLSPARQSIFMMVRDMLCDAGGVRLCGLDLTTCTEEEIERIQGQRYLWLMFCHEAAKDGFFHQNMHGEPRELFRLELDTFDRA